MKEITFDKAFHDYVSNKPIILEFHITKQNDKLFCKFTPNQALILAGMLITYAAEHINME